VRVRVRVLAGVAPGGLALAWLRRAAARADNLDGTGPRPLRAP